MPPLVRRRPLLKRLQDHLDPQDLLLQLAETLNDDAYDEWLQAWVVPIGCACNALFVIARLARRPSFRGQDDVFGDIDSRTRSGWFTWTAALLIPALSIICCVNTLFTFFRKRQYRLFEQHVDNPPATPSAHLVKVDSSPASSSPLSYLQRVLSEATAGSRPHSDPEREVWEISVWDPKPFNLTFFTLFSPGHVILYFTILPPAPLDSNPSVKVVLALFFSGLLSMQLAFLRSSFVQQAKDSTLVHGEVMNEYDTKFVRPSLNRPVRDVGTQTRESALTPRGTKTREVDVYTPTTIVNRGFHVAPNPNYASQYDPDNLSTQSSRRTSDTGVQGSAVTPSVITPANPFSRTNGYSAAYSRPSTVGPDFSSPLKSHHERLRERSPVKGDGGSLGIYSHAQSPLRKAASSSYLTARDGAAAGRVGSGLKRTSTPSDQLNGGLGAARRRETGRF